MPKTMNAHDVRIEGITSYEELFMLSRLSDCDEVIIAYIESELISRQKLLDSILTLGMKCYISLREYIDSYHERNLIANALILALEACNYHEAVTWIDSIYPRSNRIDYYKLQEARTMIKDTKIHLIKFERSLTRLEELINSNYYGN